MEEGWELFYWIILRRIFAGVLKLRRGGLNASNC